MKPTRLLCIINVKKPRISTIEPLLAFRNAGLKELYLLYRSELPAQFRRLKENGLKVESHKVSGPLISQALDTVRREKISLIAASADPPLTRPFRGTVMTELLRRSPCPVLVMGNQVDYATSGQDGIMSHLIFATNWSHASDRALHYLIELKELIQTLEIVHVIDRKLSVREMRELKEKLTRTREFLTTREIDAESHVYAGRTVEEIELAAKDYNASCLVVGATVKPFLKNLFSPNYALRVAEASQIPTLVVPSERVF